MTQREARLIAVAVVERIATGNALGVCRNATDCVGAILNRRAYGANGLDGDVFARRNAAGRLALGRAERAGVVAIGDSCTITRESGAGVTGSYHDLFLTVLSIDDGGFVEAIGDGERATVPTYETSAIVGSCRTRSQQFAIEHAAIDAQRARNAAYKATV